MHTALVKMANIGGGEGANKRALALIFKRNYCIQFSTLIVKEGLTISVGLGTPVEMGGILGVSFKSV